MHIGQEAHPARTAEGSYGGQEVRAGSTGRGSASTGCRVRPARARRLSKDAHRKQPALGTEFRFFADRQEAAARSAGRPGPTTDMPSVQDGCCHGWHGTIPRGKRAQMQDGIAERKNGGRHRQQQATAGTVSGETRSNRTGNGFALVLGISARHTGPRDRDPNLRAGKPRAIRLHGGVGSRPGRPSSLFSVTLFACRPLTGSDRVFFACPLAGRVRCPARWWPVPSWRGRLRRP
jgi:hypothetical protein